MANAQISRRQFLSGSAALLAVMGIGGLSGCAAGGDSGSGAVTGGIALGDELTIISMVENDAFNPANASGTDKVVMHSIFDNLFMFDADGNVQPMLAESYEQDGSDVTIVLRGDATFSSGNPVTADDVVFSFQNYLDDEVNGPLMLQYISGIDKVDDTTVVVHAVRDDELWKNVLAENIYVVEAASFDASANDYTATAPVGSGAYVFDSVDEARTVTLMANDGYWGGAPTFKTVKVQAPIDGSTALVALQNGEVNYVCQLPLSAVQTAQEDSNLDMVTFDSWSQQTVGLCVGDSFFRQAIFHAINRQNLIDICNNGNGEPAENFFAEKVMGDLAGSVEFTGYDLDLAKECIAKSETDLSQTYTIATFDSKEAAQCIQQDLSQIGIKVEVAEMDVNSWFQGIVDHTTQMFIAALGNDTMTADSSVQMFLGKTSTYQIPVSDALQRKIDDMLAVPTASERRDPTIEIMKDMVDEAPLVPLYAVNFYDVFTRGIGGVMPSSSATYVHYIGDYTNEQ